MHSERLKTEYKAILEKVFSDEVIYLCGADVSDEGFFEGVFAISKKRVALVKKSYVLYVKDIKNITRVCCAEFVGGGALELFTENGREIAARFSMQNMDGFMIAQRLIEEIISGETPVVTEEKEEEKLCPKCGRPFIRGTRICRKCTDKIGAVKRLWALSTPCRPIYAALLLYFWISSMITIFNPMISRRLTDDVLLKKGADIRRLLMLAALMLLCGVIEAVVNAFRSAASSKASNLLVRDLRNSIYRTLSQMPLSAIEKRKTGDLMQRINNDTARIQVFIQDVAIMAVNEAVMFLAIAFITFSMNTTMSLLIFAPMPLAIFLINRIRTVVQRRYRKQWRVMDKLTNRLTDVINGIKVVKIFGRETDEIGRFCETAGAVRDITMKNEKYVYTIFPIIRFIMSFGSYLVLLYGGTQVLGGKMTVGELVQFSSYGGYLYGKLEWFSMLPRHFTMAVASSQRIFEILDEKTQSNENENVSAENARGEFDFKNMSFGYKSYRRVLRNINAHIAPGEMIGIVGHSGAGKSTLINLIMKLYSPNRGEITLDGKSISRYDETYRHCMGIVLQENYLFSGSVLENIRYAAPNASLEDCIAAAKMANAHNFIMSLPDGYNTYVGEKGYRLSGGQRQRVSIARAICAKPRMIILDEATASVDTETEMNIQSALLNVTEGKTVFAIAHRLSTLKNADRLIVLDDGRIDEIGTHEELLERNGIYAGLLRAQQEMVRTSATIDNTQNKENEKEESEYEQD